MNTADQKDAEKYYKLLFNNVPTMLFVLKHIEDKFIVVDVNECGAEQLGYSREELIGQPVDGVIHPEYLSSIKNQLTNCLRNPRQIHNLRFQKITKSEQVIWVTESVVSIINDAGEQIIIIDCKDITQQVKEEELANKIVREASEQQEKYRKFIEDSGTPTFTIQGNMIVEANQSFYSQLGYTKHDLQSTKFINFVHPDFREMIVNMEKERRNGGEFKSRYQFKVLKKNGEAVWVDFSVSMVKLNNKLAFFCTALDITEYRRMLEALKESEAENRSLLAATPIGVAMLVDRRFKKVNVALCRITGYLEQELLGQLTRFIYPDDEEFDRVGDKLYMEMAQKGVGTMESQLKHKNGTRIDVLISLSPFDQQNLLAGVCATVSDITERKQIEEVLVANERLSAIGELASGVAHDFNNGLHGIVGNIELALYMLEKETTNIGEIKKRLLAAETAAKDVAARVLQLQRFSKKEESNNFMEVDVAVLLDEVVEQTTPLWKDELQRKGIQISMQKIFEKAVFVNGCMEELRRSMFNLIKNAVEAMITKKGGVIKLETGIISSEKVFIRISDTGIGMDEETKKRIFEPFFSNKKSEVRGGLGVSIAFSTIRNHGGEIYVKQSAPNMGTTIEIILPRVKKKDEEFIINPSDFCVGSKRVLWVDDEEVIRELGTEYLKLLNYYGDVVASGEEALSMLEKNKYDLLITDMSMPGMNGWQLAAAVKDKHGGSMKVAMVSGYGSVGTSKEKMEEYGVCYILGKPVVVKDLKRMIEEIFQSEKT